jgi:hypothetical protein
MYSHITYQLHYVCSHITYQLHYVCSHITYQLHYVCSHISFINYTMSVHTYHLSTTLCSHISPINYTVCSDISLINYTMSVRTYHLSTTLCLFTHIVYQLHYVHTYHLSTTLCLFRHITYQLHVCSHISLINYTMSVHTYHLSTTLCLNIIHTIHFNFIFTVRQNVQFSHINCAVPLSYMFRTLNLDSSSGTHYTPFTSTGTIVYMNSLHLCMYVVQN